MTCLSGEETHSLQITAVDAHASVPRTTHTQTGGHRGRDGDPEEGREAGRVVCGRAIPQDGYSTILLGQSKRSQRDAATSPLSPASLTVLHLLRRCACRHHPFAITPGCLPQKKLCLRDGLWLDLPR